MKMLSSRASIYRSLSSLVLNRALSKRTGLRHLDSENLSVRSSIRPIWFHAASAGELESLWPVITQVADRKKELVLTVFSESAIAPLKRLLEEVTARGGVVQFAGFSPCEGKWLDSLDRLQPELFVTSKYEAWPELWASLSSLDIPLMILGAKPRGSLLWAKRICRVIGSPLPAMYFSTSNGADARELRILFPEARCEELGETRWSRVFDRTQRTNPRATELLERFSSMPRPWGMVAQIWPEDIKLLNAAKAFDGPGTLWMVPHRIDPGALHAIQNGLKLSGYATSSRSGSAHEKYILVDELGILSELYQKMDWAYIGGGFGAGVHSTIEPAIHGLPVACGPSKAGQFPEVAQLAEVGQLTLLKNADDIQDWLKIVGSSEALDRLRADRVRWIELATQRKDSAGRVVEWIFSSIL